MRVFVTVQMCLWAALVQAAGVPDEGARPASSVPETVEAEPVNDAADVSASEKEAAGGWGTGGQAVPADDWATLRREAAGPKTPGYVTNFFYETPIRDALGEMALQAGTTIVADQSVQGLVTCDLKEVPLEEALRIVLAIGDYTYRDMDGFILVGTADPDSPTFSKLSETRLIRLSHIKAEDAVKMLSEPLQKYVAAVKDGNTVLVTGPPELNERIAADLALLNEAPQQIVLEAIIVVTEAGKTLDLGANWNWPAVTAGAFTNSDFHGHKRPGIESPWQWGLRVGYTPGKEFTNELLVTLDFLAESNQATVVANPQLMVQEGKEAEIKVTTEEYFNIVTEGFYTRNELEKVESGTTLHITPTIQDDGLVTLDMRTEVSDVIARGQDNLPVITRREASSTVRVEDGGTAVIAGLVKNTARMSSQGVPGLGEIPLLGYAFGSDRSDEVSRQIYVFVTPRIVPAGKSAPPPPRQEAPVILPVGDEFRQELETSLNRLSGGGT